MTLRSAVVGAGTVSGTHLSALQRCPCTRLVAVCDVDESRASEIASSYGIRAYIDVGTLLGEEDLDWLHVCTPVQTHLDIALRAIEAGVPVQIEKPVTETSEEFAELRSAAERAGVPVSVVHNHVFMPAMRKATAMIDSGRLGRVRGVDLVYSGQTAPDQANRGEWTFDLRGGEFEEGIPHPLYVTIRAGGYPRSEDDVRAQTSLVGEYDLDFTYDGAQVEYVSESGALCSTKILSDTQPERRLRVYGEDGAVTVDLVSQTVTVLDRDYMSSSMAKARNNVDRVISLGKGLYENVRAVAARARNDDWETEKALNAHYYQIDAEAEALLAGDEMPLSLDQPEWTMKLLDAVRDAGDRDAGDRDAGDRAESKPMATDD